MTTVLVLGAGGSAAANVIDALRRAGSRLPDRRRRRVPREAAPVARRRTGRRAARRRRRIRRRRSRAQSSGGRATSCTRSPIPEVLAIGAARDRIGARTYLPPQDVLELAGDKLRFAEQMRDGGRRGARGRDLRVGRERRRHHRRAVAEARARLGTGTRRRRRARVAPGPDRARRPTPGSDGGSTSATCTPPTSWCRRCCPDVSSRTRASGRTASSSPARRASGSSTSTATSRRAARPRRPSVARTVDEPAVDDLAIRAIRALDPVPRGAYCVDIKESATRRPERHRDQRRALLHHLELLRGRRPQHARHADSVRARRAARRGRQLAAPRRPLLDPHGRHGLRAGARRRARPLPTARRADVNDARSARPSSPTSTARSPASTSRGRRCARRSRSTASTTSGTIPTCSAGTRSPGPRSRRPAPRAPVPFVMRRAQLGPGDRRAHEQRRSRGRDLPRPLARRSGSRVRAVVGRRALGGPKTDFEIFSVGLRHAASGRSRRRDASRITYTRRQEYELDFARRLGADTFGVQRARSSARAGREGTRGVVRIAMVNNFFVAAAERQRAPHRGPREEPHRARPRGAHHHGRAQGRAEDEIRDGYRVVRLPCFAPPKTRLSFNYDIPVTMSPRNLRRLFRILDDFDPDVVHQHGQFFDLTWMSAIWARRRQASRRCSRCTPRSSTATASRARCSGSATCSSCARSSRSAARTSS